MTTITERMEYASAAAHDFADAAMVQLFEMLHIHERISDETAAKHHPMLLAALIDAAAKTYAVERQSESAERIAEAIGDLATAIRETGADTAVHIPDIGEGLSRLAGVARDALNMADRAGYLRPETGAQS